MILSKSLSAQMDQDFQKGEQLIEEIKSFIEFAKATQKQTPNEHVFVWKTAEGNLYFCTKKDCSVDDAIKAMKDRNDTHVLLFTCMFGENAYDVPSAYFRNSILSLHPLNEEAEFVFFALSSEKILKNEK